MHNDDQLVDRTLTRIEMPAFSGADTTLAGTTDDVWQQDARNVYSDAAGPSFDTKGSLFRRHSPLNAVAIPPELFPLFLYYKRDRVGYESPAAIENRLIQKFGVERARALITLFEQTAIPARPQEWRRRMH